MAAFLGTNAVVVTKGSLYSAAEIIWQYITNRKRKTVDFVWL